ncbi:hypothetical protein THAOC_02784 [Thalassiosira oceanica]|uniref:Uncharacterized protein n=1 Tax=Thalassiosira oceanica TaxID=159749 RepID=K0TEB4_THAOC|nr:hypothetical protein THAOC_02784 [Thalassiosira oceanica]|eukprot:EJK75489.1 hypothetical protein THAOC_02784 [Thalassiosira oceanica]
MSSKHQQQHRGWVQAASFASTAEKMFMPQQERELLEESNKRKQDELDRVLDYCGERVVPRTDINYNKPLLFKVKGGAEIPLPRAKLDKCTVLDVDFLRIVRPSRPTKGVACKSSTNNCPVFILAPHHLTIECLGVDDVYASSKIVSALEAVIGVTKVSTVRSCEVITDGRYTGNFGVVVPRGERGTRHFSYHKKKLGDELYDDRRTSV